MEQQPAKHIESVPGRPRWWQWPTILALDAPAVVLAWQAMFAKVVEVTLQPHQVILLGLSVWLAYSADRWIEGWRLSLETVRTQRHYFFLRWRWPALGIWIVMLVIGLVLAMTRLTAREWIASSTLLVPTLLYVLSHQFLHRRRLWRLPKEICVAVIISLGAAIYPATLALDRLHLLIVPVCLFMLLCLSNCLLISEWEREVDLRHGQRSLALQFSRISTIAGALPYGIVILCLGVAIRTIMATQTTAWCGAASAALLVCLNAVQPRIGRELARLLVDAILLTPLVGVFFV